MVGWRYKICPLLFFSVFLLITFRLFYWQVKKQEEFKIKADSQRTFSEKIPGKRGEIYTKEKSPLVLNKTPYLAYANLPEIKDKPEIIAKALSEILVKKDDLRDLDFTASISAYQEDIEPYEKRLLEKTKELKERLSQKNLVWVVLSQKVSKEKKEKIKALGFSGIGFEEVEDRDYPEASTAAHISGFLGKNINGEDIGYFGLEGYYDRELKGQEGGIFGERDVFGIPILIGRFFKRTPRDGHSLILNLDLSIQKMVEKELKDGILKYQASGGTVIVLNPKNGRVLAMVSFPVYNPAAWQDYKESSYKNPAIADSFEPGSILKPLIMSMAINEGKVKPTTRCDKCAGSRVIGGHTIRTFDNKYHPNLTMTEVLEYSDNIGMTFVGETLGIKKLYNYLDKFGFGKLTGIDLQEEAVGELRKPEDWYEIDKATVSFGQGIAVTGIQMVQAMATLANGGKIYQPYVVSQIETKGEKIINIKPKFERQVLNSKTAKVLTEMLVSTCEKSPLHFARERIPELKNYRIAAKSGTAQIPIAGKYIEGKTIGSVIGFAPADNPQFLVLVKLNEPQANPWGANTAGPIFFKIMRGLLIYYGISP